MRIAFYAPLKPPDHPEPSGDRQIARLLIQALRSRGHQVLLASRFRSRDGAGDPLRQARLQVLGAKLAQRLLRRWQVLPPEQRPQAWLTYHLYHKAPDWLGSAVADCLGIPYLVVEASLAAKQAVGPWASGHAAAAAAVARAEALICLNPDDEPGLRELLGASPRLYRLAPFLDCRGLPSRSRSRRRRERLAARYRLDPSQPWLVAVAMMRPGDKLASYALLAAALARLRGRPWSLLVVGGGSAGQAVRACLRRLGPGRVRYLGLLAPELVPRSLAACDLLVWPAVNEAFGMALLEAQAVGVPVVAGGGRGVSQVVAPGRGGVLVAPGDSGALGRAVARLLERPGLRCRLGNNARRWALAERSVDQAGARLEAILQAVLQRRR